MQTLQRTCIRRPDELRAVKTRTFPSTRSERFSYAELARDVDERDDEEYGPSSPGFWLVRSLSWLEPGDRRKAPISTAGVCRAAERSLDSV